MAKADKGDSLRKGDLAEEDSGHRGSQPSVYGVTVDKVLPLLESQLAYLSQSLGSVNSRGSIGTGIL